MKKSAPATSGLTAPPGVECLDDAGLLIWRPRGVLNEAVLNKLLAFLVVQEGRLGRNFNRFTDMSLLDAVDLTFRYVFYFALYRRLAWVGRDPVKSAILATTPEVARYAKLHRLMTDHSPLQVNLFRHHGPAAKWLDVPRKLLAPPA